MDTTECRIRSAGSSLGLTLKTPNQGASEHGPGRRVPVPVLGGVLLLRPWRGEFRSTRDRRVRGPPGRDQQGRAEVPDLDVLGEEDLWPGGQSAGPKAPAQPAGGAAV